jgi:hypothetical protein
MYKLVLSKAERDAFDWVGYRYATGNDASTWLAECLPESVSWDDAGDVVFDVPEYIAWEVARCSEEEEGVWPCFGPELAEKMRLFVDSIV